MNAIAPPANRVPRSQVVRTALAEVEPESRPALQAAAQACPGEDAFALGLALLEAVPPSPVSHMEQGRVGRELLLLMAQDPQAPPAITVTSRVCDRLAMYTTRREAARTALRVAASATPGALATIALETMDRCGPYPADHAAISEAMLEGIAGLALDVPSREVVERARTEFAAASESDAKAAVARPAFEALLELERLRAETRSMAERVSETGAQIRLEERTVLVGGVPLRTRSRTPA